MAKKPNLPKELEKKKSVVVYNNLGDNLQEYKQAIARFVEDTDFTMIRTNTSNYIENTVVKPIQYFVERVHRGYTVTDTDIDNVLGLVQEMVTSFSEKTRFQPTVFTFCKLMGVSSRTFENWSFENNERGEAVRRVQDYFKNILAQGMLTGEYNPVAGSFIGKSTLGMKEQDASQMNINIIGSDMSLEDIMADYQKNNK